MRLLKWILIVLGCVALVCVSVVVALVTWMGAPTSGPRIGKYDAPKTAVLVVDIQEDFTGPAAKKPFRDAERIVTASNELIAQAQEHGALVVFIENTLDNPVASALLGGLNAPGAPGTEMDRRLTRVPGGPTFPKGRGDAFSNPALDEYLRRNQVDRLLIVGLDGAHCVSSTARGALNRGYRVILLENGIATESGTTIPDLAKGWREAGATVMASMQW